MCVTNYPVNLHHIMSKTVRYIDVAITVLKVDLSWHQHFSYITIYKIYIICNEIYDLTE